MNRENKKNLWISIGFLAAFVLWTVMVKIVDVRPIGPEDSQVGFAAVNGFFHNLTGVHFTIYDITDLVGLLPFGLVGVFGLLGLTQWIRRKSLLKVDRSILVLGGFYAVVLAAFVFFEVVVINYRPVLIEGELEASYPSSHTMLAMCVIPTAIMQFNGRIQNALLRRSLAVLLTAVMLLLVIGRLVSGVHWLTDIIGGGLLSTGLVMLYRTVNHWK
ncbi:MAG: phosphatase PAP2 family protein [Ruminococcaceae bacterium]|nr:phosphatase PAP2 family protein [Oscillospiraceae bacterium]